MGDSTAHLVLFGVSRVRTRTKIFTFIRASETGLNHGEFRLSREFVKLVSEAGLLSYQAANGSVREADEGRGKLR